MDSNGNKTGGRKKRTPNKRPPRAHEVFYNFCRNLKDVGQIPPGMACDPLERITMMMLGEYMLDGKTGETVFVRPSPELEFAAAKELAGYLYPKRQATQLEIVDSDDGEQIDPTKRLKEMLDETRAKIEGSNTNGTAHAGVRLGAGD